MIMGALLLAGAPGQEATGLDQLRPFLATHCVKCHGPRRQEHRLRFDTLGDDLTDQGTLETWQGILDQLNLGEMPPPDQPRPPAQAQATITASLTSHLKEAYARQRSTGARTVMRRLNRIELRNTLRDLLSLQGPDFDTTGVASLRDNNGNGRTDRQGTDPVQDFPADEEEHGFDNIGRRLVMSDFLLKLIVEAAEDCLERATHDGKRPNTEPRRFAGPMRTRGPNPGLQSWAREVHQECDVIFERYREPGASTGANGRVAPDELARKGVGLSARYRITVEVSAHNQRHPWGDLIRSRQDEPMLLGLHMADSRRGGLHEGNPTCQKVTEWTLTPDGVVRSYTFETWLDATWTPWVGWENAPYDRNLRPSKLVKAFLPNLYEPAPGKEASKQVKQGYEPRMGAALLRAGYRGPHVRVHGLTVQPLIESWPPKGHTLLYGDGETSTEHLLLAFARRAFRSPVRPEDVKKYVRLVELMAERGSDPKAALRAGYTAILCSPRFYYLHEPDGAVGPYQVATRLSYFLWSSMPDQELMTLADSGQIDQPSVILDQVDRMLSDPKARAFTRRFTERWLRLDRLGAMPPERSGPFRIYWDRQLEPQMVAQTDAFFADLVRRNGPIRDLIHSDYTFLNERVAFILYGRDDVWGDGFRRVPTRDPKRGGIFTQPSVMTATANGVDTSPVTRGVWVLENVLGTPPDPPPPDVEPLAPDLRGAQTIREQLAKHREIASCNACHRKIDPMGFPLENFDPMGRWRGRYPATKKPIDPSSVLASGEDIPDLAAFKRMLLAREEDVIRCLTKKLLTYASGRTLEPVDRGEVDQITRDAVANGAGLRDLIKAVATSRIFLGR